MPVRPRPALDLIGQQEDVAFGAEPPRLAQVPLGRDPDAGLALDRLDEERDDVGIVERGLQRLGVTEGTDTNPGVKGPKPVVADGSEENPTIVIVLPWKFPSHTTIFARPSGTPFTS